jgi:broad specificity phosphatase PhoE
MTEGNKLGNVKHLFVVRHGHPNKDGNLGDGGRQQIKTIADKMKAIVGDSYGGLRVYSSEIPRVRQTAAIIADTFQLGADGYEAQELVGMLNSNLRGQGNTYLIERAVEKGCSELEDVTHHGENGNTAFNYLMDQLISSQPAEVVAIATHQPESIAYGTHVMNARLGRSEDVGCLGYGDTLHFDLEARTFQKILGEKLDWREI